MTQEEKDLLLKDICARLPYRVKVTNGIYTIALKPCSDTSIIIKNEHILPYLRPMSSMTDKEWQEYQALKMTDWIEGDINGVFINAGTITDWLNAHHFDYRGLIPKGLAIAVTEQNNPYKT